MVAVALGRDHRGIAEPTQPQRDSQWASRSSGSERALGCPAPGAHSHRPGRHGGLVGLLRSVAQLRRQREDRLLAGLAGGLAARLGVDVTVVRVALVLLGLVSGFGVAAYVLGWLLLPMEGTSATIAGRAVSDRRGLALALALVPALMVALLVSSALGAGFVASLAWPAFLAAAGLILVWRNAEEDERARLGHLLEPLTRMGSASRRSRRTLLVRVGVGAVLLGAGLVALVQGHPGARLLRPLGGAVLLAAGLVVVFGPWWLGLARDLVTERQARVLAEQRADMAARVHDSVLQTLALIQRCAGDASQVVQLARAQERDLRSWLFEGRVPGSFDGGEITTLAEGVELIEREVEAAHGVAVETVTVGDCPLTGELRALLEAAREATVNAAKWSGAPAVSVFAEVEPDMVCLFVRDRGRGFDLGTVDPRQDGMAHCGIAESIRGRMTRHGGSATIRTGPGEGTEVELGMPLRADRP